MFDRPAEWPVSGVARAWARPPKPWRSWPWAMAAPRVARCTESIESRNRLQIHYKFIIYNSYNCYYCYCYCYYITMCGVHVPL